MRALVVYCHPDPQSFTAAVRARVEEKLSAAGAETRTLDLYARGFSPALAQQEWQRYLEGAHEGVAEDVAALRWCDTLIFVYPTWWYGLPAMLKGWLDRVLLPDVAFLMPDETHRNIRPGLRHIARLGVFTTGGASRLLTFFVGAPGKRTLLRGLGQLCAPRRRTAFAMHYGMDSSTAESRMRHLTRVSREMDRLIGPLPRTAEARA
jgi:putative NADPH-quinone reductase